MKGFGLLEYFQYEHAQTDILFSGKIMLEVSIMIFHRISHSNREKQRISIYIFAFPKKTDRDPRLGWRSNLGNVWFLRYLYFWFSQCMCEPGLGTWSWCQTTGTIVILVIPFCWGIKRPVVGPCLFTDLLSPKTCNISLCASLCRWLRLWRGFNIQLCLYYVNVIYCADMKYQLASRLCFHWTGPQGRRNF